MALQTFGVNSTVALSDLPQIKIGSGAPITTDRLTTLINQCGAEVCGLVDAFYGVGTADTIGGDSAGYPVPYNNCARILLVLLRPRLYRAAHHIPDPQVLADAEVEAENLRKRMGRNIQAEIGLVATTGETAAVGPVLTSTNSLSVDISQQTRDNSMRERWGSTRNGRSNTWKY